uniref:Uncharacterized protein n=1 Tax=Oryza glumipatula TaxID=40148 RepID=A0A0E0AR26_9ORYZ
MEAGVLGPGSVPRLPRWHCACRARGLLHAPPPVT